MKKGIRCFSVLMVMFMVSACEQNNPVASTLEPAIHEVTVHSIKNIDFPSVLWASGQVVPAHRITVDSKVSGYIRSVVVDEGDSVAKGQLLAEIDATEVNTGITKAMADIKSAKASLDDARSDVTRFRKLASTQALSEDQLRNAQVLVVTAQAALDRAEAELRSSTRDLEHVRLVAPEDAIVVERLLEPGDLAGTGTPVLRLESRSHHELEVFVPVSSLNLIESGGSLPVKLDGESKLMAKILGIVSSADPRTRQVKVRLALPDNKNILPGTYGQAQLILGHESSPATPVSAIAVRAGIEGVYVLDGESRVHFRSLHLGRDWRGLREVLAGLSPGDRVVLSPSHQLRDGDLAQEK